MEFEHLYLDIDDRGLGLITISRPDKLNALSHAAMDELEEALVLVDGDEAVRAVIITGAGEKSFVAGADIAQFEGLTATEGHRFALRGQAVFNRIEGLGKPVIAAVNGFALGGGCELALACHLRTASEQARFGQPEVNLGIIPGYGGTQRLPRIIGRGLAAEMILTGTAIGAQRAYEIGLVNRIFPLHSLIEDTKAFAAEITSGAPLALATALDTLTSSDLPLHEGLRYEATLFGQCCATEDFKEGVEAFLARRSPDFRAR
jgi:enoyl-CoA hydratase